MAKAEIQKRKKASLRSSLIRLAASDPELRLVLLPLLTKRAVNLDPDQERLFESLKFMAENDGRAYASRDAKAAIETAWRDWQRESAKRMRDDFRIVKPHLIKMLLAQWAERDRDSDR